MKETQHTPAKWRSWPQQNDPVQSIEGRIVRMKLRGSGYVYGRATGGFGCRSFTAGRAIFVDAESTDEAKTRAGEGVSCRWNRGPGLEIEVTQNAVLAEVQP